MMMYKPAHRLRFFQLSSMRLMASVPSDITAFSVTSSSGNASNNTCRIRPAGEVSGNGKARPQRSSQRTSWPKCFILKPPTVVSTLSTLIFFADGIVQVVVFRGQIIGLCPCGLLIRRWALGLAKPVTVMLVNTVRSSLFIAIRSSNDIPCIRPAMRRMIREAND
jgi:hypothetical protein